jgi:hypothetical protein
MKKNKKKYGNELIGGYILGFILMFIVHLILVKDFKFVDFLLTLSTYTLGFFIVFYISLKDEKSNKRNKHR